jgi:hypothetical protein
LVPGPLWTVEIGRQLQRHTVSIKNWRNGSGWVARIVVDNASFDGTTAGR